MADLEKQQMERVDQGKLKSKRGGSVDVYISHKIVWPILGGSSKQRISYDKINMCQFVQVLDEKNAECKEQMLTYLCDLMEDANEFSWSSAKASHTVLLCEMERGALDWQDTNRIDRICRVHVQRHMVSTKQGWQKQGGAMSSLVL